MIREKGLSLLELLITLSIVALLAIPTIPTFIAIQTRFRLEAEVQALTRALATARSEAVKRNSRITMRNNNGHWEDGWAVFVDTNDNAIQDANELVLLLGQPQKQRFIIRGNSSVASFVSYIPSGETAQTNNAWQAGTITACPNHSSENGYQLTINRGGRVRLGEISTCET